jgi:hypothetical protein
MSTQSIKLKKKLENRQRQKSWKDKVFSSPDLPSFVEDLPEDYVSRAALTKRDIIEKHTKILKCGENAKFVLYDNGDIETFPGCCCGQHLVCNICAGIMENRRQSRLKPLIEGHVNDFGEYQKGAIEKHKFVYHMVFTIKDGADLLERFEMLRRSMILFRKMGQKQYKKNRRLGEWRKIKAAVCSVEVKRGKNSGEWHVHGHMLAFCDEMINYQVYEPKKKRELKIKYPDGIPQKELDKIVINKVLFNNKIVAGSKLSLEWRRATGGEAMNIKMIPLFGRDNVLKSVYEVIKYAAVLGYECENDAMEILANLSGRRMYATYKGFRKAQDPAEEWLCVPVKERIALSLFGYGYETLTGTYSEPELHKLPEEQFKAEWKHYRATTARLIARERLYRGELLREADRKTLSFSLNACRDRFRQLYAQLRNGWKTLLNGVLTKSSFVDQLNQTIKTSYFFEVGNGAFDLVSVPTAPT